VDVLAYFAPPVHLDGLALEFRQLQLDGGAGVRSRDFELETELVSHEVVGVGAHSLPLDSVLRWLNFEPVVVLLLVGLDVGDDGLQFFFQTVAPLFVLGTGVDGQQGDVVGRLLD
jgi:hypothetical protein